MKVKTFIELPNLLKKRLLIGCLIKWFPILEVLYLRWIRNTLVRKLNASSSSPVRQASQVWVVSVPSLTSGIGHILSEWNAGLMLADALDAKHVSLPLPGVWAELFEVNDLFVNYDTVKHELKKCQKIYLPKLPYGRCPQNFHRLIRFAKRLDLRRNTVFVLYSGQNAYDHSPSSAKLRSRFVCTELYRQYKSKIDEENGGQAVTRIALHVRRGDILTGPARWQMRVSPLSWYRQQIESVIGNLGSNCTIDVYTQGSAYDIIEEIRGPWATRNFSDLNAVETFVRMAESEIIIGSMSGFSYFAAIFGKASVVHFPEEFWHGFSQRSYTKTLLASVRPSE